MPAKSDPRVEPAGSEYFYRRSLSGRDLLPAIGAGVAVGLAVFYVARMYLERTPLVPPADPRRRSKVTRMRDG